MIATVGICGCWYEKRVFSNNFEFIYTATVVLKGEVWHWG